MITDVWMRWIVFTVAFDQTCGNKVYANHPSLFTKEFVLQAARNGSTVQQPTAPSSSSLTASSSPVTAKTLTLQLSVTVATMKDAHDEVPAPRERQSIASPSVVAPSQEGSLVKETANETRKESVLTPSKNVTMVERAVAEKPDVAPAMETISLHETKVTLIDEPEETSMVRVIASNTIVQYSRSHTCSV